MTDPTRYAMQCARADGGKVNAILCLRNLIADGLGVEAALTNVIAAFPLGLNDIHEITTEARRRFASKE